MWDMEILICNIHDENNNKSLYKARFAKCETKTLYDTGATLCLISKEFFQNLGTKEKAITRAGPPIRLTQANGQPLLNLGQVQLKFKIGSQSFTYWFQIVRGLKQNMIIGLNLMKKYKLTQDFDKSGNQYLCIGNKIVTPSTESTVLKSHCSTALSVNVTPCTATCIRLKTTTPIQPDRCYKIVPTNLPDGLTPLNYIHYTTGKSPKEILLPVINMTDHKIRIERSSLVGYVQVVETEEVPEGSEEETINTVLAKFHDAKDAEVNNIASQLLDRKDVQMNQPIPKRSSKLLNEEVR